MLCGKLQKVVSGDKLNFKARETQELEELITEF
jgi:hypothetical protein